MSTPSPTTIDNLARSWDELVQNGHNDADLSPSEFGDILRDLHQAAPHLDADPQFVARLQRNLLEAWQMGGQHAAPGSTDTATRLQILAAPATISQGRRFRHPPPFANMLSAAALLLLTLLSAIGVLASTWQPSRERESISANRPAPVAIDPATQLGVLTTVRVPALPSALSSMALERWIYPPHADAVTTQALSGPMLLYVVKGGVTIVLDGGEALLLGEERGPLNPLSALSVSTGRIDAGQSLLLPAQTRMTTSNPSSDEAILIAAPLILDTISDWTLPFDQPVIDLDELVGAYVTFPDGPAEITLQRAVLAEGETLPAPPEGTIQVVGAESKHLGYMRRSTDGAVTNLEKEPLQVLILTVAGAPVMGDG